MKQNMTIIQRPFGLLALILSLLLLLAPIGLAAMPEEDAETTTPVTTDPSATPDAPLIPDFNPNLREEYLTTLDEPSDLTVAFWYDVEFPEVFLVAPSGVTYLLSSSTDGINIMIEAEYALAQIPSAEAGDWYIRYDIGKNNEFEYDLMGTTENIWIQYVNAEQGLSNRVNVSFLATLGEETVLYAYKLYLTYEGEGAETLLLDEGYAYTGMEESFNLNFSSYNSYNAYQLLLEVEIAQDGVTLFDSLESDPFPFENQTNLAAPSGIDITVSLTDRMMTADWDNYTSYRYNGYRIVITDASGEVLYSADLDSSATKVTQYITEKTDSVTVTLYGKDDALLSAPLTRTVKMSNALTLVTTSPTASSQAQLKMNLPKDTVLKVAIGSDEFSFTSEGKENVVAATLANGSNELAATFVMEGVTYVLSAHIYKDGMPPQIDFYEPYQDKVFPDGKAVLVGSVGDAVKFVMNGKEVSIEEGLFQIKLDLTAGANEFMFEAIDAVGNTSTFKLTLYGSKEALVGNADTNADLPFWIPLAIGIALGVILIVFAIVMAARRSHLKAFSTTPIVVLFSGTTLATLGMLIWQLVRKQIMVDTVNSYDFMKIVRQSLSDAYAYLVELEGADSVISLWRWIFIGSLAALVLSVIAHILVKVISSKKSAKAPITKKEKKAKQDKTAAPVATTTEEALIAPAVAESSEVEESVGNTETEVKELTPESDPSDHE